MVLNLVNLQIHGNAIETRPEGAGAAAAHRRAPAVHLGTNGIGDEGIASLVGSLVGDELKSLEELYLEHNQLTDAACATLRDALDAGALPALAKLRIFRNPRASDASLRVLERGADEDD